MQFTFYFPFKETNAFIQLLLNKMKILNQIIRTEFLLIQSKMELKRQKSWISLLIGIIGKEGIWRGYNWENKGGDEWGKDEKWGTEISIDLQGSIY